MGDPPAALVGTVLYARGLPLPASAPRVHGGTNGRWEGLEAACLRNTSGPC